MLRESPALTTAPPFGFPSHLLCFCDTWYLSWPWIAHLDMASFPCCESFVEARLHGREHRIRPLDFPMRWRRPPIRRRTAVRRRSDATNIRDGGGECFSRILADNLPVARQLANPQSCRGRHTLHCALDFLALSVRCALLKLLHSLLGIPKLPCATRCLPGPAQRMRSVMYRKAK